MHATLPVRRQCHSFFHDLNAQTNVSQHLPFSAIHNEKTQAKIEAEAKIEAQAKIEAKAKIEAQAKIEAKERCIPGPQHF